MKINRIILKNFAGIQVGMGRTELDIDFSKSTNKIIAVQARNGSGKSVLLSALSPFAYTSSLDDRSSLSLITPGKNGYKEIWYANGDDQYVIKHYYKATKDSHAVKSYFTKNGSELNENGNVRSFNGLVEAHFGLTDDMMRLLRIGTNVNSFISLTPAKRKEYIGHLIEEIDLYMQVYKKVNDDDKVIKALLQSNATNLYNCHIADPVVEEEKCKEINHEIKRMEKDRDGLVSRMGKIDGLMRDNNIDDLRKRLTETEVSLEEFEKVSNQIKKKNLEHTTLDDLIHERERLVNNRIETQSQINSLRIAIDNIHNNIERLEMSIKKITSNNDVKSLVDAIRSLRERLTHTDRSIIEFNPTCTSDDLNQMISKLQSFNQISKMILSLGDKPVEIYNQLVESGTSVDRWLKEQSKKALARIDEADIKSLLDQVFGDDQIISPNCADEYVDCPYYRLHDSIVQIHDKIQEESYSDETLHYVQVISNNFDSILNELDRMDRIRIPDSIRSTMTQSSMLRRLKNKLTFFDLDDLQTYASITKEHEVYIEAANRLSEYERQLSIYQQAGVDNYTNEIQAQQQQIIQYKSEIEKHSEELKAIQKSLDNIEDHIALITKYKDGLKYEKMLHSTLESTKKILEPLETAFQEKQELQFQLRQSNNAIASSRERLNEMERKLDQYKKLVKEGEKLSKHHHDLSIILDAVSTKKGIPVFYMKEYLGKIQRLANDLLRLIYDDNFKLAPFNVTPDEFEIPYIKGTQLVPDLKYASQSEIAIGTIAVSFALANNASGIYNILLLDEIDSGLDSVNRAAFLKMLDRQMSIINAEQLFIVSQNLSQLSNIPMSVVRLSDYDEPLRLQDVIFDVDR